MAVQIRSWLTNFINTYIIPNGNNLITGQQANDVLNTIVDSMIHRVDDKALLNLREWSSSRTFELGESCIYLGSIYQSNINGNLNNTPGVSPSWDMITQGNVTKYSFPPYDNAHSYVINDTCRYQDKLWRATAATQGNAPTSPSPYWVEVSASSGLFGEIWQTMTIYPPKTVVRYKGWLYELTTVSSLLSMFFDSELTGGIWKPLPETEQLTRADFQTKKTNSRLVPMRLYYLTDRQVFIVALTSTNTEAYGYAIFDNPDFQNVNGNFLGVWDASIGGTIINKYVVWDNLVYINTTDVNGASSPDIDTTNWSAVNPTAAPTAYVPEVCLCRYHITEDAFSYRKDSRGNEIESISVLLSTAWTYNTLVLFQWGQTKIDSCKGVYIDTRNNTGNISSVNSIASNGYVDLRNNNGDVTGINVLCGNWKLRRDSGKSLNYCSFNRSATNTVIDPTQSYISVNIDELKSNYIYSLDITGKTTIDWSIEVSNIGKAVGVILLYSSNANETIASMYNFDTFPTNIRLVVDPGLTVAITDTTIRWKGGASGITLKGLTGDWVEFGRPSLLDTSLNAPRGGGYEINSGVY